MCGRLKARVDSLQRSREQGNAVLHLDVGRERRGPGGPNRAHGHDIGAHKLLGSVYNGRDGARCDECGEDEVQDGLLRGVWVAAERPLYA